MALIEDQKFTSILFLVLSLLGAIVNAFVLLCIVRNPLGCFRNSSSYLVAHQVFSDMITSLFIAGYYTATFCDGSIIEFFPTVPKIFLVLCATGFIALFLVSFDRFLAIRFPIRYRVHVQTRFVPVLIVPIWLCAITMVLLIIFKPESYDSIRRYLVNLGGVLVLIKLFLHCLAFWTMKKKGSKIRRHNSQSSSSGSENEQLVTLKREGRFLFTVFLITVVVLLTTLPMLFTLYFHGKWQLVWSMSGMIVFTLYWLGVILGPCIYFIRLNSYLSSLKKIMCFRSK